jgi:hypothetical protein
MCQRCCLRARLRKFRRRSFRQHHGCSRLNPDRRGPRSGIESPPGRWGRAVILTILQGERTWHCDRIRGGFRKWACTRAWWHRGPLAHGHGAGQGSVLSSPPSGDQCASGQSSKIIRFEGGYCGLRLIGGDPCIDAQLMRERKSRSRSPVPYPSRRSRTE